MKIEGIPDGWELLRVDKIMPGDWYVDHSGAPRRHEADNPTANKNYVIIRRVPPPLSIPPKVFKDGWIVEAALGVVWHCRTKPDRDNFGWLPTTSVDVIPPVLPCVVFSIETPPEQRICRVTWEHGSECDNG